MSYRVHIIGAGMAGLATSVRLALRGHQVTVFERNSTPGGKMNSLEWEGFRWDTGPSLFTLPGLLEELFVMAGEEMDQTLRIRRLEVVTRYFFEDGKVLDAKGDPRLFAEEVERVLGEPAPSVLRYLERSRMVFELTGDLFIFNPFWRMETFTSRKFIRALLQFRKLDPMRTMHEVNAGSFRSGQVVQLFDRYATYNGSDPYRAPGTMNLISHLEHNLGAYFPEGGMHTIATGLKSLAEKLGVVFHFNRPVEKVVMEGKAVRGVVTGGERVPSDIVVSDMDIFYLYRDLLEEVPFPAQYFKGERSTSAVIFYWAVGATFPQLELHNILFARDYREEFRWLGSKHSISEDPTVYLFISSRVVPSDAPEGEENWYVMINAPENLGQDWDQLVDRARVAVLKKIRRVLGIDVEPLIMHETVADPRTIESATLSHRGALYGTSSNSRMAAFNRHPNYINRFRGLYFVGGSVHPGGGIPLCLASAGIVDDHIKRMKP